MSEPAPTIPPAPLHRKEQFGIVLGLIALMAAQFIVFRSYGGISRRFWLDEILTYTLVSDRDFGHFMQALEGGVETHPPTYYLLARGFTSLLGGPSETTLRLFSLFCVLASLVAVYWTLRETYPPLASFAAVVAVWSHPVLLSEALDAHFYTPLLAATTWFAWLLARTRRSSHWALKAALTGCSILLCGLHYFGVLSMVLVLAAEVFFRPPNGRRWNGAIAASAGLLATLACVPLVLRQRASMTLATWVDPPTLAGSLVFLNKLLLPNALALLIVPVWLTHLFRSRNADGPPRLEGDATALAGLTGLLLLPFVLIAFSYVVQPVLVLRYALPAVVGLTPAIAFLLARTSRGWTLLLCVWFVLITGTSLLQSRNNARQEDRVLEQLTGFLRAAPDNEIAVFQRTHQLYVVWRYAPELRPRCELLDFEVEQVPKASRVDLFTRDLARNYAHHYEGPSLRQLKELRRLPRFYFVLAEDKDGPMSLHELFPGRTARLVGGTVYEIGPATVLPAPK